MNSAAKQRRTKTSDGIDTLKHAMFLSVNVLDVGRHPWVSTFLPACFGCEFILEQVLFVAHKCLAVQYTIIRAFCADGNGITARV